MRGRAARVLWVSFWLVSLVIVTTYTGNLVAALTAKDIRLPFRTLEELAEDTVYTLMVTDSTIHLDRLQVSHTNARYFRISVLYYIL